MEQTKSKIDIGKRVRQHRLTRGIGQKELATKLGISGSALNHMETGRLAFHLDCLEDIADLFNVPVAASLSDGDINEARLLYAWRGLKGKPALRRHLLKLLEDMMKRVVS